MTSLHVAEIVVHQKWRDLINDSVEQLKLSLNCRKTRMTFHHWTAASTFGESDLLDITCTAQAYRLVASLPHSHSSPPPSLSSPPPSPPSPPLPPLSLPLLPSPLPLSPPSPPSLSPPLPLLPSPSSSLPPSLSSPPPPSSPTSLPLPQGSWHWLHCPSRDHQAD